mmetsp:Transcript_47544/g.93808  ORF Transcript_47544/g.93808 Transcript_47544/m.93808 type:complete len:94 (-) Transcript_47544:1110-1391(-)
MRTMTPILIHVSISTSDSIRFLFTASLADSFSRTDRLSFVHMASREQTRQQIEGSPHMGTCTHEATCMRKTLPSLPLILFSFCLWERYSSQSV